jgi:hypothetical protein
LRLFDNSTGPSHAALISLASHELMHAASYRAMTRFEWIFGFALNYLNYDGLIAVEHATDLGVLVNSNGSLADGLTAYRDWVYAQLSPEDVVTKRLEYMTPEEIVAWQTMWRAELAVPAGSNCNDR